MIILIYMTTSFSKDLSNDELKKRVREFYNAGSPVYLDVYGRHIHDGYYFTGSESRQEAQENLIKLIAEKTGIKNGDKVLDVGCGVGGSSIWLAKNLGAVTTGITISPVQVEIAQKLARENDVNSTFFVMDAEDMRFDSKFNVIWVVAAMTHFHDQEAFIKSASDYLGSKGKFAIFDWMSSEDVADVLNDRYLKPVSEGMLLAGLYSINIYIEWFIKYGYRITYAEDVTRPTIKTWSDALSVLKRPAVLKLAYEMTKQYHGEATKFLTGIGAMKRAMTRGKLKSGIIVAEKL
jgi:tocopherol O-methyltransferase